MIRRSRCCRECGEDVPYGGHCPCGWDLLVLTLADAPLACEVCDAVVSPADGWFAWFSRDSQAPVEACALTCHAPRHCNVRLAQWAKEAGLVREYDQHLDTFVGPNALARGMRLMLDYEWTRPAKVKLMEYLLRFSETKPVREER